MGSCAVGLNTLHDCTHELVCADNKKNIATRKQQAGKERTDRHVYVISDHNKSEITKKRGRFFATDAAACGRFPSAIIIGR